MDPLTINRLGNIRHEEIVAWSEEQQKGERVWKLTNLLTFIRQRTRSQEQAQNFSTTVNDC